MQELGADKAGQGETVRSRNSLHLHEDGRAAEGKQDSVGSQVSEGAQKTWNKTKEGTENGWDKTKEVSEKGWNATKSGAEKGWDKTKTGAEELKNKVTE